MEQNVEDRNDIFSKQIGYTIFRASGLHFEHNLSVFGLGDIQTFFLRNVYIINIFAGPLPCYRLTNVKRRAWTRVNNFHVEMSLGGRKSAL